MILGLFSTGSLIETCLPRAGDVLISKLMFNCEFCGFPPMGTATERDNFSAFWRERLCRVFGWDIGGSRVAIDLILTCLDLKPPLFHRSNATERSYRSPRTDRFTFWV